MSELLAAIVLLGVPAFALFTIRCCLKRQDRL
ncbi:MAG: hypothetical protein K0R33_3837 [Mycobacterium sp.]|jgi:hypothetical protein|nr:hypothetical protein [Mycobacterium sp.]